ncbi:hypothetical protein HYQ46_006165 [Verticillium longisporum]|nr:hypothetical protein HYQ46_006165 [Verticillium longisporum]
MSAVAEPTKADEVPKTDEAVPVVETAAETAPVEAATEKTDETVAAADKPAETEAEVATAATEEPKIIKTSAQHDQRDSRNNKKFDASLLPESDDPNQMRRQVEFYLSDANLPSDEHLWNLTGGPENKPVDRAQGEQRPRGYRRGGRGAGQAQGALQTHRR